MKTIIAKRTFLAAGVWLATASLVHADTATWDAGLTPDTRWITDGPPPFENWSGDTNPAGNDVVFGTAGLVGAPSTVTNTVNADVSINSLLYQYNSGSNWHVTEILEDVTLSVGGATNVFTVGGQSVSGVTTTNALIKGRGTLDINQSGGQVFLANNVTSGGTPSVVLLDMSGLATFKANLGTTSSAFNVGTSTASAGSNQRNQATVYLANSNEITAATLRISAVIPNSQIQVLGTTSETTLYLGQQNSINTNNIYVGQGYSSVASGGLRFNPSVSDASVRIRGVNGGDDDAVLNLRIGYNAGSTTDNSQSGIVDFTGGSVDALINNLIIGSGLGSDNGRAIGELLMDQGIIKVQTATVGQGRSSGGVAANNASSGLLEVRGGAFEAVDLVLADSTPTSISVNKPVSGRVNISGDAEVTVTSGSGIVMGRHGGAGNPSSLTARIDLDGGSLTVSNGNIAEGFQGSGTIESTINLRGGALNLSGHSISVDNFNLESGALQNLAQFNNGADLVKTTDGTLLIAGTNTWTGGTRVEEGTVNLAGSLSNGNVTVQDGAEFSLQATGMLQFNITNAISYDEFTVEAGGAAAFGGVLRFNLAAGLESGSWQLFNGTSAGDFTSLDGIDLAGAFAGPLNYLGGDLWSGISGEHSFSFNTASGVLSMTAIPEPSSLLLCLAGGLLWSLRMRNAKGQRG